MTVRHKPGTVGNAIARAVAPLGGYSNAGLALGLNASALSHFASAVKPDRISLEVAIALDAECKAAGGGAPILDYYASQLGGVIGPGATPFEHLAEFSARCADVQSVFAEALRDGQIDKGEREALLTTLADAEARIRKIKADLKSGG